MNEEDYKNLQEIDDAVDEFAARIKAKLHMKFFEGFWGWNDVGWPEQDIKDKISHHIKKGDPVDVGAFAMFLWNRKRLINKALNNS